MNIKAEDFKLELSHNEMWATACDVRSALRHDIRTHWINHQNVWEKNEAERLGRIKVMFSALGRIDMYDDIFLFAKEELAKFNEARKQPIKN